MAGHAQLQFVMTECSKTQICLTWLKYLSSCFNIRIFHRCEVRIENSVTRVAVHYHKACLVIPNSYPEWRNFQCTPNNHYGFFFLYTPPSSTAFKLKCQQTVIQSDGIFSAHRTTIMDSFSCILLLRQQHLSLNVCCFVNFMLKYPHFWGFYFRRWLYDVWQKWCQKPMWWCQNWHLDVLMFWRHAWESSYTPRCRTTFSSTGWVHGNSCLVCKKELSCRWMLLWLSLVERPLHNSSRSWVFSSTICQHGTCWCRERRLQKSSR